MVVQLAQAFRDLVVPWRGDGWFEVLGWYVYGGLWCVGKNFLEGVCATTLTSPHPWPGFCQSSRGYHVTYLQAFPRKQLGEYQLRLTKVTQATVHGQWIEQDCIHVTTGQSMPPSGQRSSIVDQIPSREPLLASTCLLDARVLDSDWERSAFGSWVSQ